MALELNPAELGFQRPFNNEVSQTLSLRNTNSTAVAFKVKTTAPKQYCVRPNSGRIDPGETVHVSVVLQPFKQDPPLDVRCKDKFLVQSIAVQPGSESLSWPQIEQTSKAQIQERKIRVHYLPAGDEPQNLNGDTSTYDESTISTSPPAYTPHNQSNGFDGPASPSGESRSLAQEETASSSRAETAASSGDLQSQLSDAQATIAKLKRELNDPSSGLRRRKDGGEAKDVRSATGESGVNVLQQRSEGVPVKWVAILCLFVFLLTHFVF